MADGAVGRAEDAGVILVQRTASRPALEAGMASGALAERFAQRAADRGPRNVAGLAVGNALRVGVEVMAGSAGAKTEIVCQHPMIGGYDLVAFAADVGAGAVAGIAVGRPEDVGVLLMQRTVRSALEPGMAGIAFAERFAQRATGHAVGVTGFAGGNLPRNQRGVEIVNGDINPSTEVMAVDAGRRQELANAGNAVAVETARKPRQQMMAIHDACRRVTLPAQGIALGQRPA